MLYCFCFSFIASFYDQDLLVPVLRALSITLFFGAVNSIQIAVISRNMQFKKLFYSNFGAIIISGLVGIFMAFNGFGVWALVAQQLVNQFFQLPLCGLQLNGDQNCYLNLNDCEVYFLWMENTCVQFDNYTVFGLRSLIISKYIALTCWVTSIKENNFHM